MVYSPWSSSDYEISQARLLSWLPFHTPGDLPDPRVKPVSLVSPSLAGRFFTTSATWEPPALGYALHYSVFAFLIFFSFQKQKWKFWSLSRVWLSVIPWTDYRLLCLQNSPGSFVCGILQARMLEWIYIPFSMGSSPPRNRTWISCIADSLLY